MELPQAEIASALVHVLGTQEARGPRYRRAYSYLNSPLFARRHGHAHRQAEPSNLGALQQGQGVRTIPSTAGALKRRLTPTLSHLHWLAGRHSTAPDALWAAYGSCSTGRSCPFLTSTSASPAKRSASPTSNSSSFSTTPFLTTRRTSPFGFERLVNCIDRTRVQEGFTVVNV